MFFESFLILSSPGWLSLSLYTYTYIYVLYYMEKAEIQSFLNPFFGPKKKLCSPGWRPKTLGLRRRRKADHGNDVAIQNRIPMDPQWTHNGLTIYGSFVVFHQFDTSIFFCWFPMNYIPITNEWLIWLGFISPFSTQPLLFGVVHLEPNFKSRLG